MAIESVPTVGYVSGVFDMFHIGHLNIIMRARGRCDRLVVGVVTDEVVERTKHHAPVIPLAERLDIVRGLRDVDEVIADPYADKFDSWRHLMRFDVLFKGDDWQGTPRAERLAAQLATVGARIEYFPYTAHTSSSLLRDVLSRLAHTPVEPHPEEPTAPAPAQIDAQADQSATAHATAQVTAQVTAQAAAGRRAGGVLRRAERLQGPHGGRHCPTCGQALPAPTNDDSPGPRNSRTAVRLES